MRAIKIRFSILLVCLLCVLCTLSSCTGYSNGRGTRAFFYTTSIDGKAVQKMMELIGFLQTDDAEGIKNMLCPANQAIPDIDGQISLALEFFKGEVESYERLSDGGGEDGWEEGKLVMAYRYPDITDISTDEGGSYDLSCRYIQASKKHPDHIGVSEIQITNRETGEVCTVGEYVEK